MNRSLGHDAAMEEPEQTSDDQRNQHPRIKIAVFLEEELGGIAQRKNIQIVMVDNLDAKQRRTDSRQTTLDVCSPPDLVE